MYNTPFRNVRAVLLKYAEPGPQFGAQRAKQIDGPPSIQVDLGQRWCDQNVHCEQQGHKRAGTWTGALEKKYEKYRRDFLQSHATDLLRTL